MLSEGIAGHKISYSNICRLLAIHRGKDERQTSLFRSGNGFIDTDMHSECIIIQFTKRERWLSTVETAVKLALSAVADRHGLVIIQWKNGKKERREEKVARKEHELSSGAAELVWIPVESGAETHTGPACYTRQSTSGRPPLTAPWALTQWRHPVAKRK